MKNNTDSQNIYEKSASSFRDPSGFIFLRDKTIYRQINYTYKENYELLLKSGLFDELVNSGLLIPHIECTSKFPFNNAYKIIKPKLVSFISYPYEWCFSQLKNAALITLKIQEKALNYGMSLKDCSAYNIQFNKRKAVFIDTLSFEKYHEGQLWTAYRQFCQHFLAPLALMCKTDIRLNQLFRLYIDGLPLDLTSSLLPFRSYFNFTLLTHIHLHSKSQKKFQRKSLKPKKQKINKLSMLGLLYNLEKAIKKLTWRFDVTGWANYYDETNYCQEAETDKVQIVESYLDIIKPQNLWDLGANIGKFSRIAKSKGVKSIISFDNDPATVEINFLKGKKSKESRILPLLCDLTNPSPGIGWENRERMSLIERGPTDVVLALALIHHLAISNNLPFDKIAHFLSKICNHLVIEFILKRDSQIQRLLSTREDIFYDYTQPNFVNDFKKYFIIHKKDKILNSERVLYLMENRKKL